MSNANSTVYICRGSSDYVEFCHFTPLTMANLAEQYHLGKLLLAFSDTRNNRQGSSIHTRMIKLPPRWSVPFSLSNKLLHLYCKCGDHQAAHRLFDEMPSRDAISYNTLLPTILHRRDSLGLSVGFELYSRMLKDRIFPNSVTLCALLGAVNCEKVLEQMHCHAVKLMLNRDVFVGGSLVGGYARCMGIEMAIRAFEEIEEVDMVCWNLMIDACACYGNIENAVSFFQRMCREYDGDGLGFDYFTLTSVVKTCVEPKHIGLGMQMHGCTLRAGLNWEVPVGNALVTMYSKCEGGMESAMKVFSDIQDRNIISWTAMISGHAHNGLYKESVWFYTFMLRSGLTENEFCFASVLSAIAGLSSIEQGKQAHARIIKSSFSFDVGVGNALIDMYFKCGSVDDGQLVFRRMAVRDRVSWTAMISGYGYNGKGVEAVEIFREMGRRGFRPDEVTFLLILSACSHQGLVDEGLQIFHSMSSGYGIKPSAKHYACVIDMLGRAGKLDEAERFITDMKIELDPLAWETLLGMCGVHGEIDIGRRSADKVMGLEPNKDGPYVLLSNMYAERSRWEEKEVIRKMLDSSSTLRKEIAYSWSAAM